MTNICLDFLKSWENVTLQEKEALESLKTGINCILNFIPLENIEAIYLAGSFPRREMNKNSDVDTYTIVNDDKYLKVLQELDSKFSKNFGIRFSFSGYSINELKTGKKSDLGKETRGSPARFVRILKSYKLVYGKELDISKFFQKSNIDLLKVFVKTFDDLFFPWYKEGKLDFDSLLKQTLWLYDLYLSSKNSSFVFTSWNELATHFNEDDLIYEVIKLREPQKISLEVKEKFVFRLRKLLKDISLEFNF